MKNRAHAKLGVTVAKILILGQNPIEGTVYGVTII
jgi:hypothetical protein